MRTTAAFFLLVGVLGAALGIPASPAQAVPQGPYCFSTLPFDDVFSLFLDNNGGNQFIVTGVDLLTNSGITGTLFLTGNTAVLSFVVPASPDGHSSLGSATLSLATASGPGVCEAVNTSLGCGEGADITLALVACPAALSSPQQQATSGARNLMGGRRR